jgi:hypothetical protein
MVDRGRAARSRADDTEDVLLLQDEVLLAVELDLAAGIPAEEDAVALLDGEGDILALLGDRPVPTATTWPSCGFSFAVSGMMMLPCLASCSSRRLTRTRSWSGRSVVAVAVAIVRGLPLLRCVSAAAWNWSSALSVSPK